MCAVATKHNVGASFVGPSESGTLLHTLQWAFPTRSPCNLSTLCHPESFVAVTLAKHTNQSLITWELSPRCGCMVAFTPTPVPAVWFSNYGSSYLHIVPIWPYPTSFVRILGHDAFCTTSCVQGVLERVVDRCGAGGPFRCDVGFGHTTVDNHVMTIDKAALIACQE